MFSRICAAALIVLAASPFTAPFATCDLLGVFLGHHGPGGTATIECLIRTDVEAEALIVPPLTTRDGEVSAAVTSLIHDARIEPSVIVAPTEEPISHVTRHAALRTVGRRTLAVLRL